MKKIFSIRIFYFVFLGILGFCATWFFYQAAVNVSAYLKLENLTSAHVTSWDIKKISNDKYVLVAEYEYTLLDRTYNGKTVFKKPRFINSYAAKAKIQELEKSKQYDLWYYSKDPLFSSLEKFFPVNLSVRTTIATCVFLYFLFLFPYIYRM